MSYHFFLTSGSWDNHTYFRENRSHSLGTQKILLETKSAAVFSSFASNTSKASLSTCFLDFINLAFKETHILNFAVSPVFLLMVIGVTITCVSASSGSNFHPTSPAHTLACTLALLYPLPATCLSISLSSAHSSTHSITADLYSPPMADPAVTAV